MMMVMVSGVTVAMNRVARIYGAVTDGPDDMTYPSDSNPQQQRPKERSTREKKRRANYQLVKEDPAGVKSTAL